MTIDCDRLPLEIFEYIVASIVDVKDLDGDTVTSCVRFCRSWYNVTLKYNLLPLFIMMDGNPLIARFMCEIMFAEHSFDDEKPNVVPWVNGVLTMLEGRLPNQDRMSRR